MWRFLHLSHLSRAPKCFLWGLTARSARFPEGKTPRRAPPTSAPCQGASACASGGVKSSVHGPKGLLAKHWAQLPPGTVLTWWYGRDMGPKRPIRWTMRRFGTCLGLAPWIWPLYSMPSTWCNLLSSKGEKSWHFLPNREKGSNIFKVFTRPVFPTGSLVQSNVGFLLSFPT